MRTETESSSEIKLGNRYSEELLSIPLHDIIGFDWSYLIKIHTEFYTVTEDAVYGSSSEEMIPDKHNIICLLAAMSDEDLNECFGI